MKPIFEAFLEYSFLLFDILICLLLKASKQLSEFEKFQSIVFYDLHYCREIESMDIFIKNYIYISIVIHTQICFVLSELISVARQYHPVAGIETRLIQTPSPSF